MLGATHALFGATLYVGTVTAGAPVPLTVGGFLCAAGSALLPDIDHPASTVSKFLGPVDNVFRSLTGATHRGLTHSWPFAAVAVALFAWWRPELGVAFGVGWVSHLCGDMIPKTGGVLETCIRWLLWAVLPVLLLMHFTGWRPWA